ncbi:hypothetical protein Droror1_Dr00025628 [Drosera rotundifolia]
MLHKSLRSKTSDQEERYLKLKRKGVLKTSYLDTTTLTTSSLKKDVDTILQGLSMEEFAYNWWPAYKRITYEFLSTLELITKGKKKDEEVLSIRFCLGREAYEKPIAWLS